MTYYVRQVLSAVPPQLREELRQSHGDILLDVIAGRSIAWDSIDGAEAPVFGTTTIDQVQWATRVDDIVVTLQERLDEYNGEPAAPPPCSRLWRIFRFWW